MPRISEFFGITVFMYYREHGVPHLHAHHGGSSVTVSLETREVLAGGIAASSQRLLLQWMEARAEELAANWQLARDAQPLRSIEPLQ